MSGPHLNPLSVNVAVQDDPLVLLRLVVGHVAVGDAHEALPPLARGRVQAAVQLITGHRLQYTHMQMLCKRTPGTQRLGTSVIVS